MIGSDRSNNLSFRLLRGAATRCLLVAVPLAIAPAAHAAYNLTFVTDPTGTGVHQPLGINNSGTIAGFDNGTTNAGFTLTLPSNFTAREFSGATSTQVTGINAAGDLSGIYVDRGGQYAWLHAHRRHVQDRRQSRKHGLQPGARHQQFRRDRRLLRADRGADLQGDVAYSQEGGVFTDINRVAARQLQQSGGRHQ